MNGVDESISMFDEAEGLLFKEKANIGAVMLVRSFMEHLCLVL